MLLKKQYTLAKGTKTLLFVLTPGCGCGETCKYYNQANPCSEYKPGCLYMIRKFNPHKYRYVPK